MFRKFIALFLLCSCHLCLHAQSDLDTITDEKSCFAYFETQLRSAIAFSDNQKLINAKPQIDAFFTTLTQLQNNSSLDLSNVSWSLYPKFLQAMQALSGTKQPGDDIFRLRGYTQGAIVARSQLQRFVGSLDAAKTIPMYAEDSHSNYASKYMLGYMEEALNNSHIYYQIDTEQKSTLQPVIDKIKEPIANIIGSPWRIVNLRVFKPKPTTSKAGPHSWHIDACPSTCWKILFYPNGASPENGTTELMLGSNTHQFSGTSGAWFLFKNTEILHRTIPPTTTSGLVVEITITAAAEHDLEIRCAGLNAQYPKLPWMKIDTQKKENEGQKIVGINLRGGGEWHKEGWMNLENVVTPSHPSPFAFYSHCTFPFSDKCTSLVYTAQAMTLENTATIYRLLSETHRTLQNGGHFVIKLPNFDEALKCWRANDPSFFGPEWNIENFTALWYNKSICDCMDHRIAMIFCSFYNGAFAPYFSNIGIDDYIAYFGPPTVEEQLLKALSIELSPSALAREYCRIVKSTETDFRLYNQSAWSKEELKALLSRFGFEVVTFDTNKVLHAFGHITDIETMKEHSTYCWAKKK
jgi:hypothetical protein